LQNTKSSLNVLAACLLIFGDLQDSGGGGRAGGGGGGERENGCEI
jgi:hypothetical protein